MARNAVDGGGHGLSLTFSYQLGKRANRISKRIVMDMNATVAMIVSLLNFDSSVYLGETSILKGCVMEGYFLS